MTPERYGIYLAHLHPTRSAELSKTRPVVVVSLDALNAALETVVVCPLTTTLHPKWRSRIQVTCEGTRAEIAADRVRPIRKAQLCKKLGRLSPSKAAELRGILGEMLTEP
jgi:mRNA interferase MazF